MRTYTLRDRSRGPAMLGRAPPGEKCPLFVVTSHGSSLRMPTKQKPASKAKPPNRAVEDSDNVASRQRDYKGRRRERGETRVSVWVPEERAQQLRDIATMWRRESELRDGLISPTPAVKVPVVEIPELPPPGYAWVRVEEDELAMRKLMKLNGGEWFWRVGAWRIRSDLVDKLGLANRVVFPSSQAVAS